MGATQEPPVQQTAFELLSSFELLSPSLALPLVPLLNGVLVVLWEEDAV